MTETQWEAFSSFRSLFKNQIEQWKETLSPYNEEIRLLQKEAAARDKVPPYSLDNIFVYNKFLDNVLPEDDIKIILIGDNPGKAEQLMENQAYLVGQSGKIADNFFKRNPELGIDFRKNVIILNKTPFHTAKTKELKTFEKCGIEDVTNIIRESQVFMAEQTARLHQKLQCQLWLVGYSELKNNGIFIPYRDALKGAYKDFENSSVYVYQHFSMNRFLIDLKERSDKNLSLKDNLLSLGKIHRKEIFS